MYSGFENINIVDVSKSSAIPEDIFEIKFADAGYTIISSAHLESSI